MSDKEQQSPYPLAPASLGYPRSDADSAAAGDLRRKKRNKCILYIVLFTIFQIGIITLFSLTVMKVRTPRFRLRSAALTDLSVGTPASPSFAATVTAELSVRNSNSGPYKYREATVEFLYRGAPAGEAVLNRSRAGLRSTKKAKIAAGLKFPASPQLASDLRAGILPLSCRARIGGKVELFWVMKKKTNSGVSCSMDVIVGTQELTNISCK